MADSDPNDTFKERCASYVLHALDKDQAREFEQMLARATRKERLLYQEMLSTANQLAFSIERSKPSKDLKDRLMQEVESQNKETDQQENRPSTEGSSSTEDQKNDFTWTDLAVPASFALLIVSLSLVFYSLNLSSTLSDIEEVIASQETTITELNNELQRKEELLSILEAREADIVRMSGLEVTPDGYGKIILDSQKRQALLHVSKLPSSPNDKNYHLWLIKDNKPISAGVFSINKDEDAFIKIENLAVTTEDSSLTFMITLEPSAGASQPTGDTYLMGSMDK